MQYIEVLIPKNENLPERPSRVLINLDGVLEISVRSLQLSEKDKRNLPYGLFVTHRVRELVFHGTKSDCERGYDELLSLLDSGKQGLVGTFTFSPVHSDVF